MLDIYFYEVFEEEERAIKKYLPDEISAGFTWKTIQESGDTAMPAKLISIRTQSTIPLDWAKDLKGILSRSEGYDHILQYRKDSGVAVNFKHLDNYCSRAVAEHAVLIMMCLLRKLKAQIKNFDGFHRDGLTGMECNGKKALVVGVGKIGSEIVDCLLGLKMEVKGVDIEPKDKRVEYVTLKEGLKEANVVFSALPLTEDTNKMFTIAAFENAKQGIVLVNISRGEITPVKDVKTMLDRGTLGGVGLDVYCCEKELADYLRGHVKEASDDVKMFCELKNRENVIFTPHNAFNTVEAVEEKARQSVEAVVKFVKEGKRE
ncbi:MAG: hydroxyacid dehydrogenase [Candidatus Omnitrophica bacterium]|nr:hydroxyacid dehydrogenase [Candidatus Omnitrophota bacterium]MBU1996812.1 hydroxyacid dehydrogenase [Candidatus Omnitrophota bacterium]